MAVFKVETLDCVEGMKVESEEVRVSLIKKITEMKVCWSMECFFPHERGVLFFGGPHRLCLCVTIIILIIN